MKKYCSYIRVSTKAQGISGLSLESQKRDIDNYILNQGGTLIGEYKDVETGTAKRVGIGIHAAIQHCINEGAELVIAKLDRLARDVSFVNTLLESKLNFVALDLRGANKDTIRLMATIAHNEAERIRSRIKSALDSKRVRGEKMGNIATLELHRETGWKNSVCVRREIARIKNEPAIEQIKNLRESIRRDTGSVWTFAEIANTLNKQKLKTTRGNSFTPKQVQLLYLR